MPGEHRVHPTVWVPTTYFAEGLPYMVVNELAPALFQQLGVGLRGMGLTALFHLPWNIKFLWGQLVDRYETKRRWLIAFEVMLTLAIVGFAFIADMPDMLVAISGAFVLLAFLAATHDIAIDAFYMEALDRAGQARHVGLRVAAYRGAMAAVGGPGIMLIAVVGWRDGLLLTGGIMGALSGLHGFILPREETRGTPLRSLARRLLSWRLLALGACAAAIIVLERRAPLLRPALSHIGAAIRKIPVLGALPIEGWIGAVLFVVLAALVAARPLLERWLAGRSSPYFEAYRSFLAQPRVGVILAFVLLYRIGESLLIKMKLPFLIGRLGLTLGQYGLANGTVGLIASIVATMVGGWLISKHGLRRWLWPFVLAQNVLNLLYVGLAYIGAATFATITIVVTLERIGEGLGTAVFMVYLMRCCAPEHKATHFAIVSALMSVGFTVAGVSSGYIAEAIGFELFFTLSLIATIPSMALLVFLPHVDGREEPKAAAC